MKIFQECLPEGIRAVVEKDSYPVPPIFKMLAKEGRYRRTDDVQHIQHGYSVWLLR